MNMHADPASSAGAKHNVHDFLIGEAAKISMERDLPGVVMNTEISLLDCGLDSLGLAILVARLEDQFGVDPLADDPGCAFPVTVGDFIGLYERATSRLAA